MAKGGAWAPSAPPMAAPLVISKPPKGKELSKKGGSNVELAKFRDEISPVKKLFMFWNDKNTDLRCFYHLVLKNVQALLSNITFF